MEQETQSLSEQSLAIVDQVVGGVQNLLLPSRLTQVAILVALALIAFVLRRWLGPQMHG